MAESVPNLVPPCCLGDTIRLSCHLVESYRVSVKDKGRVVLPVALQRACGFGPGDELVVRPIGPGRFVVESTNAVLERIWSGAPQGPSVDAVESLEGWRTESDARRGEELDTPRLPSEKESDQRAARLLSEFGL